MKHQIGLNGSADFDQYSFAGVDFGEDYSKDYGVEPNDLEGKYMDTDYETVELDADSGEKEYECDDQLGSADFGVLPQGMGIMPKGYFPPMKRSAIPMPPRKGLHGVPSGMYGESNHLGMGGIMDTLNKPLVTIAGFSVTPLHLALVAAAGGAYWWFKIRKK